MLFSFVRISYNQKSRDMLRLVPFIKATLEDVSLITLVCLSSYEDMLPSDFIVDLVVVFLEVGL